MEENAGGNLERICGGTPGGNACPEGTLDGICEGSLKSGFGKTAEESHEEIPNEIPGGTPDRICGETPGGSPRGYPGSISKKLQA